MKKLLIFLILSLTVALGQAQETTATLKLLAIGNSFSEDALEQYLHELAVEADRKIIIGNLYIGGAPLDLHLQNAEDDLPAYSYRKITADGIKTTVEEVRLSDALHDEEWTHVSLQQASPLSGKYTIIQKSLPGMLHYLQQQMPDGVQLIYHQTWAYQSDADHEGFANYARSQSRMYRSIAKTTKKLYRSGDFDLLIPCGTAIQNARQTSIGDHFTRDGFHLELSYGRFTAACTWFEKLFGMDVRKMNYIPARVTKIQAQIAKEAAHQATLRPFKVSKITHL